jgi:hypothetical protein
MSHTGKRGSVAKVTHFPEGRIQLSSQLQVGMISTRPLTLHSLTYHISISHVQFL